MTTEQKNITVRFARDTSTHTLTVLRDDGVYRHIRLAEPGTMSMHFDLITWPGYLCYTGDMGTFVFSRLRDMFEFFRRPVGKSIDYRYWAEKCEGADKGDGVYEFSPEEFKREIYGRAVALVRGTKESLSKEQRRELWEDLRFEVLDRVSDYGTDEGALFERAHEWAWQVRRGEWQRLDLDDFPSCRTYTLRFLWCCHAMAWGIAQYDTHKAAQQQPAASTVPATDVPEGCTPADARVLREANHQLAETEQRLRQALRFYAAKEHFSITDDTAWDTVSGEPQNYWCDEAGTAMVEDGSIAAAALRGAHLVWEEGEEPPVCPGEPEHGIGSSKEGGA